jgi:hypothetical protein
MPNSRLTAMPVGQLGPNSGSYRIPPIEALIIGSTAEFDIVPGSKGEMKCRVGKTH